MLIETRMAVRNPTKAPVGVALFHSIPTITTPKSGTMKKKMSTCKNSRIFEK